MLALPRFMNAGKGAIKILGFGSTFLGVTKKSMGLGAKIALEVVPACRIGITKILVSTHA